MNGMLIIGIAGGSGSGKSTVTDRLVEKFGSDITVIRHDDYYNYQSEPLYENRARVNYDAPAAFETDLMVKHLEALRRGEAIDCPVYDFTIHNRSDKVRRVVPTKILLIDGFLVLHEPKLRELMDIRIYVDTDADVRVLRRILRDVRERGRTLESVINQYLATVKPMHEMYVEPSKKFADIIVPEGGYNTVALEMLEDRLRAHLAK